MTRRSSITWPLVLRPSSITAAAIVLLLAEGCFSPNAKAEDDDDDASETSGSTDAPTTDASTTGTTTTSPSTSDDATSGEPTSGDATAADSESSGGSDDDGPAPFCGDGNIDEGEECDDGDDNGPGQACRADCQLNVCGDSDPGPEEACDDGPNNKVEVGACAPDCSTIIEAKKIAFGAHVDNGNLGLNPVATVDGLCQPGQKALFAHKNVREFDPLTDWPLRPYTAYLNNSDEVVWITDSTPALGIRNGVQEPLENLILTGSSNAVFITGLNTDWSTRSTKTCNGWSSASASHAAATGYRTDLNLFLDADTERPCNEITWYTCYANQCIPNFVRVYCVEQ
jgi:hypothetical protein